MISPSPTTTTTTTTTTQSTGRTLPAIRLLVSLGLCAYHVRAEATVAANATGTSDSPDFIERFTLGPDHLTTIDIVLFVALGVLAMEIVNAIAKHSVDWFKFESIPVRGKHLDDFSNTDLLFIGISKVQTGPFVYFLLRYAISEPNFLWMPNQMSFFNVILPLPILFLVFDFFYTILHWALHIKAVYGFVHKHHHTQKAPSRANDDAINVHPIEYILGEYNHLFAFFLCCRVMNMKIHAVAALLFLSVGAVLAGWNHVRYDITINFLGLNLYDSKAHDVHHRIPQSNYGQYTVFWDYLFGSYRPYDPNDRVNPRAQLDPKTGKSYEHADLKKTN
eukprot:Nitzschia sp. Nitz4//scaffold20_size174350//30338//31503//NITZ4_002084-RA/size174350-snap-gene-0.214-mRNA-1//1//CDS//3329541755//9053//frame0